MADEMTSVPAPVSVDPTPPAPPHVQPFAVRVTKSTVIELHGPMTPRGKKDLSEQVTQLVADGNVCTQLGRINGRVMAVFEKQSAWGLDEFLEELDGYAKGERGPSGTSTRK